MVIGLDGFSFDIILARKFIRRITWALKHEIYNFRKCLRIPQNYFELFCLCLHFSHWNRERERVNGRLQKAFSDFCCRSIVHSTWESL